MFKYKKVKKNGKVKKQAVPTSEDELQILCVSWFERNYGECTAKSNQHFMYHIPNQGKRSFTYLNKLIRMGLKAGIPDLHLTTPAQGYNGLFIEMKFNKGKLSRQQTHTIETLRNLNYKVVVCNSFNMFKKIIIDYLGGDNDCI